MRLLGKSLLDLKEQSQKDVEIFFQRVDLLKKAPAFRHSQQALSRTAALVFFESSTRTRMSFETACHRIGLGPLLFDAGQGTSLDKGETKEDSVLNIASMDPSCLIIRTGGDLNLRELSKKISIPIINAGWGTDGHPTQALLDAYTIWTEKRNLPAQKVLIVGDVKFSRVAASNIELFQKFGTEVALCAPPELLPEKTNMKVFGDLNEGLQWATVVMALRVQLERHDGSLKFDKSKYSEQYSLTSKGLQKLSGDALIMHPGPINHGVELLPEVLSDSRSRVLTQVRNGVFVREALLREILGMEF